MPQFLASLVAYTLSFGVSTHSLFLVEVGYRGCRGPVLCQADNASSNINLWALNNIVPIYGEFPLPNGHCNEEACGERDIAGWWAGLELTGFSVSRSALIVVGLMLLIGPQLLVQRQIRSIDDVLVSFPNLLCILSLAWIVLFMSYLGKTYFVPTNNKDFLRLANETEQYLSALHDSAISPFGLLGLCAAASVMSTMLWWLGYVMVHWSFPIAVHHGLTETLHMLLLVATTQFLTSHPSRQWIHYFFLKVVCFNATWRLIDTVQCVLLDRSAGSHLHQQLKALFILGLTACEPTILAYLVRQYMETDNQLTAWLTFPVILFRGVGAGILAEYLFRIGTKNMTRFFGYVEDDIALFALVIRKFVNLVVTWHVLGELASVFHSNKMAVTFLSCLYLVYLGEAIYTLATTYQHNKSGVAFSSMTSLPVTAGDHPRICSICQVVMSVPAVCHVTPCGHAFHERCLAAWLEEQSTCFKCGQKLN